MQDMSAREAAPQGDSRYVWQDEFAEIALETRLSGQERQAQQDSDERAQRQRRREAEGMFAVRRGADRLMSVRMPPGYGKTRAILIQARAALQTGKIPIVVVAEPYRAMVFQIIRDVWSDMADSIVGAVVDKAREKAAAVGKAVREEEWDAMREQARRALPSPMAMVGSVDTRVVRTYLTVGTYENISLIFTEERPRVGLLTRVDMAADKLLDAWSKQIEMPWTNGQLIRKQSTEKARAAYGLDGLVDTVVIDEAHNIYKERGVEIDTILGKTGNYRRLLLSGTMPGGITDRLESVYGRMTSITAEESTSPYGLEWMNSAEGGTEESSVLDEDEVETDGSEKERMPRSQRMHRVRAYAIGILRYTEEREGVTIAFTTSRVQAEAVAVAAYNTALALERTQNKDQAETERETEAVAEALERWIGEQPALTQDGNAVAEQAVEIYRLAMRTAGRDVEESRNLPESWIRPTTEDMARLGIYVDHSESNSQTVREVLDTPGQRMVRFVAATTTLAEGVNVRNAVRAVIPKSTLWDWAKYRQMQGRVGRFREGEVVTTVSEEEFRRMTNPAGIEEPRMTPLRTAQRMWEDRHNTAGRVRMAKRRGGYWLPADEETTLALLGEIGFVGRPQLDMREDSEDRDALEAMMRKRPPSVTTETPTEEEMRYALAISAAREAERRLRVVHGTASDNPAQRMESAEALRRTKHLHRVADEDTEGTRQNADEDAETVLVAQWVPDQQPSERRSIQDIVTGAALVMAAPVFEAGRLWSWTMRYAANGVVEHSLFLMEMAGSTLPLSAYIGMIVGVRQLPAARDNPHAARGAFDWTLAGEIERDWTVGYIPPFLERLLAAQFDEAVAHGFNAAEAAPTHFDSEGDLDLATQRGKAVRMARIYSHFTHWAITVALGLTRRRQYKLSPRYAATAVSQFLNQYSSSVSEGVASAMSGFSHVMLLSSELLRERDMQARGQTTDNRLRDFPFLSLLGTHVSQGTSVDLLRGWLSPFGVSEHTISSSPLAQGDTSGAIGDFLMSIR